MNKLLMLVALFAAFALAPMATYGQSKSEDPRNVNVVNTPNVNIANTPKVLNANDLNIFQESRVDNNFKDSLKVFTFTVPLGKRLVIEYASVFANLGKGEKVHAFVRGGNGFQDALHPIVMTFQATIGGHDLFVGSQAMKLYAEPGTTVDLLISRRDAADTGAVNQDSNIEGSISGYLVDVPQDN
jgi:hypothetical protein